LTSKAVKTADAGDATGAAKDAVAAANEIAVAARRVFNIINPFVPLTLRRVERDGFSGTTFQDASGRSRTITAGERKCSTITGTFCNPRLWSFPSTSENDSRRE